jgi:uncharacterized protein YbaR (Trm112 family)/SAM-dependent methyltransferase
MHLDFFSRLRCPFCGTRLQLVENDALDRRGDVVHGGVIGCECCAFPVVDGIPVLMADDTARAAIVALESGDAARALDVMLGLDGPRAEAFRALTSSGSAATYRALVDVLSPDAEGTYFVYRFSDPTFLMAEAVLTALAADTRTVGGWVLDVCGGSGHLTRVLMRLQGAQGTTGSRTALADVFYWKLWLARQVTAPMCHPVCCDANDPLPFEPAAFSMAVLSDAFPYIWHKRLLAGELMRATGPDGVVVLPHLHSADGWNFSQGMALTPRAYADLFEPMTPRMFRDRDLLDGVLDRGVMDLATPIAPDAFGDTPSVTLVAGRRVETVEPFALPSHGPVSDRLIVNPLYDVLHDGDEAVLRLAFPTPEYEDEFGGCRRYLPVEVRVPAAILDPLDGEAAHTILGDRYWDLRRQRVLIDAPVRYC